MSQGRRLALLSLCALAAVWAGFEPAALAKKKAVVLGFSGPKGSRARSAFIRGMRRGVKVIGPRPFAKAARRLGVSPGSADGIAAVCSRLRCDAAIKGRVKRRGRYYTITVTVYHGGTGAVIGRRAARVRGARRLSSAGAALGRTATRLVAKGRYSRSRGAPAAPAPVAAAPREQPASAAPGPAANMSAEEQKEEEALFQTAKRSGADREAGDTSEEEEGDGEEEIRDEGRAGSSQGLFDLSVAIGFAVRSYELAGADPANNSNYDGGAYPELVIHGRIFPLVLATRGFLKNLGIGISYARHLTISTKLPPRNGQPERDVDTGSQELLLDLRLRWKLSDSATAIAFHPYAGFGLRSFDLGQNDVLAAFGYKFLRFGVDVTVPLGTPILSAMAGFDVRPLLSVGQDAIEAYGLKDGGLGWALRGGVQGTIISSLFYFATFELISISTDFSGLTAAGTTARAGEFPDREEPVSGSDRFIRAWAGVGYSM